MLRTTDGGKHWRPQRIASGQFPGTEGVISPTATRAYALTSTPAAGSGIVRSLFTTGSGGDAGTASSLTLTADRKTLTKKQFRTAKRRITVKGTLKGAQGGEPIVVSSRNAGSTSLEGAGRDRGRQRRPLHRDVHRLRHRRVRRPLGRRLRPPGRGLNRAHGHSAQVKLTARAWDARTLRAMSRARAALGVTFIATGALHFLRPRVFEAIVPDYLPAHRELVYASGVAEIAGGAGVLLRARPPRPAGWWLIATLLAVFPANVEMAVHAERFRQFPEPLLWARLPLQGVLIAWAWLTAAR